jgi:hypothetical protein
MMRQLVARLPYCDDLLVGLALERPHASCEQESSSVFMKVMAYLICMPLFSVKTTRVVQ